MKNTPPHVKLTLPDGSRLTAVCPLPAKIDRKKVKKTE